MSGGDRGRPAPGGVQSEVDELLREMLHEADDLLPFAWAVVLHLSRSSPTGIGQMAVATQVLEALAWGVDGDDEGEIGFFLDHHPALLASFFQNADLLDPHSPRTAFIARAVMSALERVDPAGDG